jgi:hypothetical protein
MLATGATIVTVETASCPSIEAVTVTAPLGAVVDETVAVTRFAPVPKLVVS